MKIHKKLKNMKEVETKGYFPFARLTWHNMPQIAAEQMNIVTTVKVVGALIFGIILLMPNLL